MSFDLVVHLREFQSVRVASQLGLPPANVTLTRTSPDNPHDPHFILLSSEMQMVMQFKCFLVHLIALDHFAIFNASCFQFLYDSIAMLFHK